MIFVYFSHKLPLLNIDLKFFKDENCFYFWTSRKPMFQEQLLKNQITNVEEVNKHFNEAFE